MTRDGPYQVRSRPETRATLRPTVISTTRRAGQQASLNRRRLSDYLRFVDDPRVPSGKNTCERETRMRKPRSHHNPPSQY